MKTLKDYPISFPYGSTKPPYSKRSPHRGNDRACPVGTPVVIEGVTIGLTGNTGLSTGPHCHDQAGTDPAVQKTVNPRPYEFKAGTVTNTRNTDTGDWGKFVTIKVGSHYITYAHLSSVKVKVGQVIKGEDMPTDKNIRDFYKKYFDKEPTANQLAKYKKAGWRAFMRDLMDAKQAELKKCQASGPESNDQEIKDGLFNKIKGIFGK